MATIHPEQANRLCNAQYSDGRLGGNHVQCYRSDHVDNVDDALSYYIALKKLGVPVEMHLYAQGGHAFGLRRTRFPITGWPQLVETRLGTIGMIPQ